jgi:hypothetical protein
MLKPRPKASLGGGKSVQFTGEDMILKYQTDTIRLGPTEVTAFMQYIHDTIADFQAEEASMTAAQEFERAEKLGDQPIEDEYHAMMRSVARAIDELLNGPNPQVGEKENGFVLLVFKFGDRGRCNFISNGANREDITVLFKEMIARFEGAPHHEPGHA